MDDKQGQSQKTQKQFNTAKPPANLPGVDDNNNPASSPTPTPTQTQTSTQSTTLSSSSSSSSAPTSSSSLASSPAPTPTPSPTPTPVPTPTNNAQKSEIAENKNVPERNVSNQIFPEEATKKIPSDTSINKFGDPEDLIPKGLPATMKAEDKDMMQDKVPDVQELEKPKEEQLARDLTNEAPNNLKENEYAGPSIEDLEKKNLIKKVIVLVIIGAVVVLSSIYIYNKWIKKPVTESNQEEVIEKEPVVEEDIDEDGLPNEWEEKYGFNPKDARDGDQDPDFDRLTNIKEYEYGTDPKKADTDGDGFKDGEEVQGGYNPNGSGKLDDSNNQANYYPSIKGGWQGTMTGAVFSSETFEATLQSNGGVVGNLEYMILNTDNRSLECELNGVFTFKKETSVFTSKINSNAGYKEGKKILTRGNFNLNFTGTLKENQKEISGTWVLEPVTDIFWLKQDRGNFIMRKITEF